MKIVKQFNKLNKLTKRITTLKTKMPKTDGLKKALRVGQVLAILMTLTLYSGKHTKDSKKEKIKAQRQNTVVIQISSLKKQGGHLHIIPANNGVQTNILITYDTTHIGDSIASLYGKKGISLLDAYTELTKYVKGIISKIDSAVTLASRLSEREEGNKGGIRLNIDKIDREDFKMIIDKLSKNKVKPVVTSDDFPNYRIDYNGICVDVSAFTYAFLKSIGYNPELISFILLTHNDKMETSKYLHEAVLVDGLIFDPTKPFGLNTISEYVKEAIMYAVKDDSLSNPTVVEGIIIPAFEMDDPSKASSLLESIVEEEVTSLNDVNNRMDHATDFMIPGIQYTLINELNDGDILNAIHDRNGIVFTGEYKKIVGEIKK